MLYCPEDGLMRIYNTHGNMIAALQPNRLKFLLNRAARAREQTEPPETEENALRRLEDLLQYYHPLRAKGQPELRAAWQAEWNWDGNIIEKIIRMLFVVK